MSSTKRPREEDEVPPKDKESKIKKAKKTKTKKKDQEEGPIVTPHALFCTCTECKSEVKLKDVSDDKRLETEEEIKADVVRIRKLEPILVKPSIRCDEELFSEALSKATDMVANEFVMYKLMQSSNLMNAVKSGPCRPPINHFQWCLRIEEDTKAEDTPIGMCLRLLANDREWLTNWDILGDDSYSEWNEVRIQVVTWLKKKYASPEQYVKRIFMVLEAPEETRPDYLKLTRDVWSSSLESVDSSDEE